MWVDDKFPALASPVQCTQWATRILESVRRAELRDVRVQYKLQTIADIGCPLSRGGPALGACRAL